MSGKILLVDDNADFRDEFRDCLIEFDVEEASSGEEALEILGRPHEIDLVILDVNMPGISGTKALKKIKTMKEDIGVIILTGYSTKDIAVEALRGNADDYLEKPIDIEKTKKVIDDVLRHKRGEDDINSTDIKGKVERIKRFIERNIHKRLRLSDAAEVVYLSPKYLSRIFKEHAGVGFSEYRLNVKMERACRQLRDTGYSVSQIAYDLGYRNAESFIRRFKEITGHTPSEYRHMDPVQEEEHNLSV